MVRAWRIVKARYADAAFDGEGARLLGGRWNSPGTAMVYTSDSPALAALELLVGLDDASFLYGFVLRGVEIPERSIATLDPALLPASWQTSPAPPELARLGDDWIRSGRSAALRVPSAVVPQQTNLLLDPRHRDFATLRFGPPESFRLDRRLLRRR